MATSLPVIVPHGLFPSIKTKRQQQKLANYEAEAVNLSSPPHRQEYLLMKHKKHIEDVRKLLTEERDLSTSMRTIDSIQRLGIDYRFKDEIETILSSIYGKLGDGKDSCGNLFEVALSFRLLRQARYPASTDMFKGLLDGDGGFKLSLHKDIKGMLSLYEASHLNAGENLLYEANAFTSKNLRDAAKHLEPHIATKIIRTLEHPYHLTIPRYRIPFYLGEYERSSRTDTALRELAKLDFDMVQSVHQAEAKQVLSWWKNLGLADELRLARDQPKKWYMWSMNVLPDPKFSEYRIEIVKLISLVYILDDIYDVYGTLDELTLLTHAVNEWELSAANSLPEYMRKCYKALYNITNEVAEFVLEKYGQNPINSFKKQWTSLCDAFLQEARWHSSGNIPNADEYLENAVISTGVHVVLVPLLFLLGEQKTKENLELIEKKPSIITYTATILRLWDDLGSAKDENQQGYDGSYVECYKKEHPNSSTQAATDRTMQMITKAWEGLNKELIKSSSFSSDLLVATLNTAKMVRVMYTYSDNQTLPLLNDYETTLLQKHVITQQ